MALQIDQSKVQLLENKIQEYKNAGMSLEDILLKIHNESAMLSNQVGVAACGASVDSLGNNLDLILYNPAEMATAIRNTNPSFTPLDIAILTKKLYGNPEDVVEAVLGSFTDYKAIEMGKLLINTEIYPNLGLEEMKRSLKAGNYTEEDITSTLNEIYGFPAIPIEVNFYEPTIIKTNAEVQTGPGTLYNDYYQRSWRLLYPGSSYVQVDFNHSKTGFSAVNLVMVHLTSMTGGHNGYSPIDIFINDQVFKSKYDVVDGNYKQDTFDITPYISEGKNTIRLNYCKEAITHYWIQNLKVDYVK